MPYCFCLRKVAGPLLSRLAPRGNSRSQRQQEGLVRYLWERDVRGRGARMCEHGVLGGPGSLAPAVAVSTILTWIPTGAVTNWEQMTHL